MILMFCFYLESKFDVIDYYSVPEIQHLKSQRFPMSNIHRKQLQCLIKKVLYHRSI